MECSSKAGEKVLGTPETPTNTGNARGQPVTLGPCHGPAGTPSAAWGGDPLTETTSLQVGRGLPDAQGFSHRVPLQRSSQRD